MGLCYPITSEDSSSTWGLWARERRHNPSLGQSSSISYTAQSLATRNQKLDSKSWLLGPGLMIIFNQLPELLELLYFAECSSLFSTADRFDFFKNKREMGKSKE